MLLAGWGLFIWFNKHAEEMELALAIGLLIGVERSWKEREAREGERIAGVRTYGLIGLLGGAMALVAERLGPLPLALAFVALAGC